MRITIIISLILSLLFGVHSSVAESISSPIPEHYESHPVGKNPWNMTVFDGKLYVASGDYNTNSGKTPIFTYDVEKGEWCEPYLTSDESLEAFRVIDGKLYAVGNDSTLGGGTGNYYVLDGGVWTAHTDIPGAFHVFDAISFGGKTFFGIGVDDNLSSPVLTLEGGEYSAVDFIKNGKSIFPLDEAFSRAYNFLVADGELYAFILKAENSVQSVQEFYRYNGEVFEFVSERDPDEIYFFTLQVESDGKKANKKLSQNFLNYEFTKDGYAYFTTGALFKTKDFLSYERLVPNGGAIITDTVRYGDEYYALGFRRSKNNAEANVNVVWRLEDDDSFTAVASFGSEGNYALSLAVSEDEFFVGMGNRASTDGVGEIYRIKREK